MNRTASGLIAALGCLICATLSAGCSSKKLVGLSGTISLAPAKLAYDAVTVGQQQEVTVTVTNVGSIALQINAVKIASDPNNELFLDALLTNDCTGHARVGGSTLAPAECASFNVGWLPARPHAAAGAIEIDSTDGQNPVVTIPITSGQAYAPAIQLCVLALDGGLESSGCSSECVLEVDGGDAPAGCAGRAATVPTVDFGAGAPGETTTRTVRVFNRGAGTLSIAAPTPEISATAGTPSLFAVTLSQIVQPLPDAGATATVSIDAGSSIDLTLTATPDTYGDDISGELDIKSNDPIAGQLAVPLRIVVAGWALCIDPASGLDFGTVAVGQTQTQQLTFTNCGIADLQVDQFTFTHATVSPFALTRGTVPAVSTVLSKGEKIPLGISYTPTGAQTDQATIDYSFQVGGKAIAGSVLIRGNAMLCSSSLAPITIASGYGDAASGNYTQFTPALTGPGSSPVAPLDWVQFTAPQSVLGDGGIAPAYVWTLTSQPNGSTATLPNGTNTFAGPQIEFQTLVSGTYELSLGATDASGCVATEMISFEVVPRGDVHIELTWDQTCGDLDLHYVQAAQSVCDGTDCSYANPNTSWGAHLDVDDTWGSGPENITQGSVPPGGAYAVWVYYYSNLTQDPAHSGAANCDGVNATVKVYIGGVLGFTSGPVALAGDVPHGTTNQGWHAADIQVSANTAMGTTIAVTDPQDAAATIAACQAME